MIAYNTKIQNKKRSLLRKNILHCTFTRFYISWRHIQFHFHFSGERRSSECLGGKIPLINYSSKVFICFITYFFSLRFVFICTSLSNGRYKSQDQVQDVLFCSNVCCCNWPFISQFVVRQGTHFLNVMCFVEKFTLYISEIICFRKNIWKFAFPIVWQSQK